MRFVKFRARLEEIARGYPIEIVSFEEVRRHRGTDAAHVYGGLLAILTEWCESRGVPYEGVPVGEIKQAWTGKGNADKTAMMQAAFGRGYSPSDDNEADAIAIFCLREGICI